MFEIAYEEQDRVVLKVKKDQHFESNFRKYKFFEYLDIIKKIVVIKGDSTLHYIKFFTEATVLGKKDVPVELVQQVKSFLKESNINYDIPYKCNSINVLADVTTAKKFDSASSYTIEFLEEVEDDLPLELDVRSDVSKKYVEDIIQRSGMKEVDFFKDTSGYLIGSNWVKAYK